MMLMKRRKNGMTKNILVRVMALAIDYEYVDNGGLDRDGIGGMRYSLFLTSPVHHIEHHTMLNR